MTLTQRICEALTIYCLPGNSVKELFCFIMASFGLKMAAHVAGKKKVLFIARHD